MYSITIQRFLHLCFDATSVKKYRFYYICFTCWLKSFKSLIICAFIMYNVLFLYIYNALYHVNLFRLGIRIHILFWGLEIYIKQVGKRYVVHKLSYSNHILPPRKRLDFFLKMGFNINSVVYLYIYLFLI